MTALVSYASSDDEEEEKVEFTKASEQSSAPEKHIASQSARPEAADNIRPKSSSAEPVAIETSIDQEPIIGPTIPEQTGDEFNQRSPAGDPLSPYSSNRALLRDLTLPSVPNYDIPQSPSGSPVRSTNAKFAQFMKLKSQGVHFNEKLTNSAAMKNPSLMQKLLDFAGIDDSEQYETTLPVDLWNPGAFPDYAFKEGLSKSQQSILKKKEAQRTNGQRESIEFIPANGSNHSSRNGTPKVQNREVKSAAERVMAGLDKPRSRSPQTQGLKRKSRFDT